MSGHRVELKVSFWVEDGAVRQDVETVISVLEAAAYERGVSDFRATPSTVDGNGWFEKYGYEEKR